MKRLLLIALLPVTALAGGNMGQDPGGHHGTPPGVVNNFSPDVYSKGGQGGLGGNGYGGQGGSILPGAVQNSTNASATGQGGSNSLVIQGQPANQRIEYVNTPSLGAMYTPGVNPCTMSFSGQAVGPGTGAGATIPFMALGCHFMELAKTNASIGVAAVNIGAVSAPGLAPNLAVVAAGQNAVMDAMDLLAGTDINLYLLRKAQGRVPPIRPDRGFLDNLPGGLIDQHVLPTEGYQLPRPPIQHHDYGNIPESRNDTPVYDQYHKREMMK